MEIINIEQLIKKLTPNALKELTLPNLENISTTEWHSCVDFIETDEKQISLFKMRNEDGYTNRFSPNKVKTCYLAKDSIRLEDEVQSPKTLRDVSFISQPKLLNFNFSGPINSEHITTMKENDIFEDIKFLIDGPRTSENYEASCDLAKHIYDQKFDGIYYSPHPDAKNNSNTTLDEVQNMIHKTSPHFDINNAIGTRLDPMIIVFESTKSILKFKI